MQTQKTTTTIQQPTITIIIIIGYLRCLRRFSHKLLLSTGKSDMFVARINAVSSLRSSKSWGGYHSQFKVIPNPRETSQKVNQKDISQAWKLRLCTHICLPVRNFNKTACFKRDAPQQTTRNTVVKQSQKDSYVAM